MRKNTALRKELEIIKKSQRLTEAQIANIMNTERTFNKKLNHSENLEHNYDMIKVLLKRAEEKNTPQISLANYFRLYLFCTQTLPKHPDFKSDKSERKSKSVEIAKQALKNIDILKQTIRKQEI